MSGKIRGEDVGEVPHSATKMTRDAGSTAPCPDASSSIWETRLTLTAADVVDAPEDEVRSAHGDANRLREALSGRRAADVARLIDRLSGTDRAAVYAALASAVAAPHDPAHVDRSNGGGRRRGRFNTAPSPTLSDSSTLQCGELVTIASAHSFYADSPAPNPMVRSVGRPASSLGVFDHGVVTSRWETHDGF